VRRLRFHWMWSEVYKGLEISWGPTRAQSLPLTWTPRKYRKLGW